LKIEDIHNIFENRPPPQKKISGRQPQIFENKRQPQCFWKMEDDCSFYENGR
jgi:hypothetical protein